MFSKACRFESNKENTQKRITKTVNSLTRQKVDHASEDARCFICDEIIKSCSRSVVTHSLTNPGNKIVHCDNCYNFLASKAFKSVIARASSDFYDLEVKVNQTNDKLVKNSEAVADIEDKICNIQLLLEKFINDINNNCSINRSNPVQESNNVVTVDSVSEISKAESDNLQDRLRRKNRAVIFNVPCYEEDKNECLIKGVSDYDLIVNLMQHGGLKFEPKECFRVMSGSNAESSRPPLIVEFHSEYQKFKFLSNCRGLINEFKEVNQHLRVPTNHRRFTYSTPHWINSVSIAHDRTYADRKLYKELKEVMIQRNNELDIRGETEAFWTIRKLKLCLIEKQ